MLQHRKYRLLSLNFHWIISLYIYIDDYGTASVFGVHLEVFPALLLYFESMKPVLLTQSVKCKEVSCESASCQTAPGVTSLHIYVYQQYILPLDMSYRQNSAQYQPFCGWNWQISKMPFSQNG